MKKITFIALLFSSVALLFSGCSDEFLEAEPNSQVSEKQLAEISKTNPEIQAANVAGLYSTMINTGTGGTTRHNDFGQKGYDLWSDLQSGDMVLLNKIYGWYSNGSDRTIFVDNTITDLHYQFWRYYYRIIFGANAVINALSNDLGTEAPELEAGKHYLGQALAMRAYAYYYLSVYLSTEYDATKELIPIYTTSETANTPYSSMQDVYDLIISDLTLAVDYLETFERGGKSEVDKTVAQGLLAYAYAYKGDNTSLQEALDITTDLINSGVYPIMEANEVFGGGFNDVNTPGWMWGADLTLEIGLDLISWWGMVDIWTYSYASVGDTKGISQEIYDRIPADDARKGQFLRSPGSWADWTPYQKFIGSDEIQGQREVTSDYVFMRISEMYLLNAEVAAKLGSDGPARTSLKAVLAKRLPDPSYVDALSGQALLDEIFYQTRLELWGEGKAIQALKRNKATVTFGTNHLDFPGEEYSYNDETMVFQIPENETLNNPSL